MDEPIGRDGRVLGVPAVVVPTEAGPVDAIAGLEPPDVLARLDDLTCDVHTRRHRQLERLVRALAEVDVDGVDAGSVDLDQYLVALRVGTVDLVDSQHVGTAILPETNGVHAR